MEEFGVHLHARESTCYTEKTTAFIMAGCLSEVWPDPWAVKCPCIYFSSLNIGCLWRSPGPQTCCCHLVRLCWRGSVPCCHPLQGKGSLGGAPGTRDTLLGVGPSELAMRSSLKICLQTPWKQERGCSVTSPGPRRVDTGVFAKCGPANTLRKTQEAGFATSCSKCRRVVNKILRVSLTTGDHLRLVLPWNSASLCVSSSEIYIVHCWHPTNEIWAFFCFMELLVVLCLLGSMGDSPVCSFSCFSGGDHPNPDCCFFCNKKKKPLN